MALSRTRFNLTLFVISFLAVILLSSGAVAADAPASAGRSERCATRGTTISVPSFKDYEPRAEQGDRVAQTEMGTYYLGDDAPDPKYRHGAPNYVEAFKWYRKAAEQGDTRVALTLSKLYLLGEGTKQDYQEAYFWASLALQAEKWPGGLPSCVAVDGYDAAKTHLNQDQITLIDQRVKQSHPELYRPKMTPEESLKLLQKSQKNGIITTGQPVAPPTPGEPPGHIDPKWRHIDPTLVAKTLKGAEAGVQSDQGMVGGLYAHGVGVQQDWSEALFWFSLAQYKTEAADAQKHLTPDQVTAVMRRVRDWRPVVDSKQN